MSDPGVQAAAEALRSVHRDDWCENDVNTTDTATLAAIAVSAARPHIEDRLRQAFLCEAQERCYRGERISRLESALRRLDDAFYPLLAGRAINLQGAGEDRAAAHWNDSCRLWREIMDEAFPCQAKAGDA